MGEPTRVWWWPAPTDGGTVPDLPPIDITDRAAARHVPGRCDRWRLDTPAGPCADQCVEDWMREVGRG